jgi:flagellar basal-body rod modification protein FlgD
MVASISNLSSTAASTSATGQTSAKEQTDRFMKLLVAQLNNQDPMNPMDNAQMTSQIAQINTVSGIQEVNDSIKSMATQFASLQMMQGASMIGREVLTEDSKLAINGGVGKGAIDLSGSADKVTVQILSSGGQVLDTLNLGPMAAGRNNFEWNAANYSGTGAPSFKVSASSGAQPVSTTSLARSTVESISSDANGMNLTVKGGGVVAYSAIKAIL